MKSFKKSLVFLMVFAMLLSTVAPVFAAQPTDIAGTPYEAAVGKLVSLGVIAGYEDGTFKPDQSITRAEFAKIACYVVGVKDAATLSAGATKFKDVPSTHWASGFVNIASEKGLIKGYTDGTFKPEANVTYAEAITILVRALGMGPVVEGKGTWPANYLAKASAAGVTDDVEGLTVSGNAVRGAIAQLAWNTLGAEVWGEKEYNVDGIVYGPLNKALIKDVYGDNAYYNNTDDRYEVKEFNDVDVTGTHLTNASTIESDEIKVKSDDLAKLFGAGNTEKTVTVDVKGMDLNTIFGKKVDILFGKDNHVAYIKVKDTDVVEGTVEKYDTTEHKIKVSDKDYLLASDAKIYVDGVQYSDGYAGLTTLVSDLGATDKSTTDLGSTAKVTLVLDSGKVAKMQVFVADNIAFNGLAADKRAQFIVKEIKSTGDVRCVATSSSKIFDLDDLTDANDYVIVKNGKVATKDDIKVGDAVTYVNNGSLSYIVISDTKVTGSLTSISSATQAANTHARKVLTVGGKDYDMPYDGSTLITKVSSTDDEDVKAVDDMKDFFNKDITLTLNALGEVLFVSGNTKGTSANMEVGVVTRALFESGENYSLKVLTPAGETKLFTVKGDKFRALNDGDLSDISSYTEESLDTEVSTPAYMQVGKLVAYDVSSDGIIDSDDLYAFTDDGVTLTENVVDSEEGLYVEYVSAAEALNIDIKDSSEKIVTPGGTYYADDTTTYLNMASANVEKIKGWNSIVSADKTSSINDTTNLLDNGAFYLVKDEDGNIVSVILGVADTDADGDANYLDSDASYAVYVGNSSDSEDDYVTLNIAGAEKKFVVAGTVYSAIAKGDLIKYTLNGDGEVIADNAGSDTLVGDRTYVQDAVDADDTVVTDVYNVKAISGNKITFEDDNRVTLASDVVIYDCRDKDKIATLQLSDITADMYIVVADYDSNDDDYGVVAVLAD